MQGGTSATTKRPHFPPHLLPPHLRPSPPGPPRTRPRGLLRQSTAGRGCHAVQRRQAGPLGPVKSTKASQCTKRSPAARHPARRGTCRASPKIRQGACQPSAHRISLRGACQDRPYLSKHTGCRSLPSAGPKAAAKGARLDMGALRLQRIPTLSLQGDPLTAPTDRSCLDRQLRRGGRRAWSRQ